MRRVVASGIVVGLGLIAGCPLFIEDRPTDLAIVAVTNSTQVAFGQRIELRSTAAGGATPYYYRWGLEQFPAMLEDRDGVLPNPTDANTMTAPLTMQGNYLFRVVVTDGVIDSRSAYLSITVAEPTPGEVLEVSIDAPTGVEAGEAATIRATTAYVGDVRYQWEVVSGEATIANPTAAETQVTATTAGMVTLRVTMTDQDTDESTTDEVTITVAAAGALTVAIDAPTEIRAMETATLTATPSNAVGQVTYAWRLVSGPGGVNQASSATATYSTPVAGTAVIEVTVTDSETDAEAMQQVTITVLPVSELDPFTIEAGQPRLVSPGSTVMAVATVEDNPGGLDYMWTIISGEGEIADPTSRTTSVTVGSSGTLHLRIQATATGTGGATRTESDDLHLVTFDSSEEIIVFDFEGFGEVRFELDTVATPTTTANFLAYVDEMYFDNTAIHRVEKYTQVGEAEPTGFGVIQGGGYDASEAPDYDTLKTTYDPIINESSGAGSNVRGTIAMARTNAPDSATSQFFLNTANNSAALDFSSSNAGYAVFGTVISGLDVLDRINDEAVVDCDGICFVTDPIVLTSVRRE
jgi:cyclophilin family peptidyl-prolyl cis-trans isomerase